MQLKDLLQYRYLVPLSLLFGLAPFLPQPHLFEKLEMLFGGELHKPIDVFDLFWHGWPLVVLGYRIVTDLRTRR